MIVRRGSSHNALPDLSSKDSSTTPPALPELIIAPAIKKSVSIQPKEAVVYSASPQQKVYQIYLNRETRDASPPPPRTAPPTRSPLPSLHPITNGFLNEAKNGQSGVSTPPQMSVNGSNYKSMKIPHTASGERDHYLHDRSPGTSLVALILFESFFHRTS